MRLTPNPISTSEAPTKDYRASLRLWHWGDALFITGQLLTILFLKVIVNARSAVPEFLQGLSRDHVTLSVKQANSFAHIISDRIWQWHVYIGLALAAFWLLRVLIELSSPSPLKYSTRLAEVARRYRLAPAAGKGEAGKVLFAKSTYALFYVLLTVMVITGLILTWADDVTLLHRMEGPAKEIHNVTMYLIIAFLLVHVVGVVWAELSKEPGLISRMVGGERKPEQARSLGAQFSQGSAKAAEADPAAQQSAPTKATTGRDLALSMATTAKANASKTGIRTRHVAILAMDSADVAAIGVLMQALMDQGAQTALVATHLGTLKGQDGQELLINGTFQTKASVLFYAVYVAGGAASVATLQQDADAVRFVNEAYRHCKSIAASAAGVELLKAAAYPGAVDILGGEGVVTATDTHVAELTTAFIAAIAQHRFWNRELRAMPAKG